MKEQRKRMKRGRGSETKSDCDGVEIQKIREKLDRIMVYILIYHGGL